jgi:hypothetical protein
MNFEKIHAAMMAHEWAYKEDLKTVYCETCGKQQKDTVKKRTHRPGCDYKTSMDEVAAAFRGAVMEKDVAEKRRKERAERYKNARR